MRASVVERLQIEPTCAARSTRGEIEVHYQPIVDLAERRIAGFEALVRWQPPGRGLLAPDEFIPRRRGDAG